MLTNVRRWFWNPEIIHFLALWLFFMKFFTVCPLLDLMSATLNFEIKISCFVQILLIFLLIPSPYNSLNARNDSLHHKLIQTSYTKHQDQPFLYIEKTQNQDLLGKFISQETRSLVVEGLRSWGCSSIRRKVGYPKSSELTFPIF